MEGQVGRGAGGSPASSWISSPGEGVASCTMSTATSARLQGTDEDEPPDRRHVRDDRPLRLRVDREDLVSIARPTVRSRRTSGSASTRTGGDRRLRRCFAGREQWTVRAAGSSAAPDRPRSGRSPTRSSIRSAGARRLDPNDVQPISFDLVLRGVTPPFFEERNPVRNPKTNRIDVNVIRYHQGGWAPAPSPSTGSGTS